MTIRTELLLKHVVEASTEGRSCNGLARQFFVDRTTMCNWLDYAGVSCRTDALPAKTGEGAA